MTDLTVTRATDRPWPPPPTPWSVAMRWHDLLFMHWRIDRDALRRVVPPALSIDPFDGSAWIGVVPFRMSRVRLRRWPALPWISRFPELNVRTYVTHAGKPGVWFFSLDAANPIAVRVARRQFHLPYFDARMTCRSENGDVHYASVRTHRGAPPAELRMRYRPFGDAFHARPGTLEHFLTARYCLYSADAAGSLFIGDIDHAAWPLESAEAEIDANTMLAAQGFATPTERPLLHFARELDVVAWSPSRAS